MRSFWAWAAHVAARVLAFSVTAAAGTAAHAGTLTKAQVEALFPPPLLVGEKGTDVPVWPIYRRSGSGPELQHHVFETIDLEPAPGYSGKPINLLVVLDADGHFSTARLLSHFEPIFRSDAGTRTLDAFAAQYQGLTVNHNVQVLTAKAQRVVGPHSAILHGIVAGTVTALAIDRSILESAAQVAQAQLAPGAGTVVAASRVDSGGPDDRYTRAGWNALAAARLVQPLARSNREVEAAFRGTPGERLDAEGMIRPDTAALDLWFALASLPQAGRNLLDAALWREVRALREAGTSVLLAIDGGRYRLAREGGAGSLRSVTLTVEQGGRRFALRELPLRPGLRLSGQRSGVASASTPRFYAIEPAADGTPFDLLAPLTLQLAVQRLRSDGTAVAVALTQRFEIPDASGYRPARETPRWLEAWQQRSADLAILLVALGVLTVALARQRWLVATPQRLAWFRNGFLLFTLVWIGWIAQGQLTIVTITALAEALAQRRSLEFLLADPVAVVLWAVTGLTLVIWGRGTFCGWLCPFGALQELLARAAALVGWKPRVLHRRTDAALKWVKHAVLAALVAAALMASPWTDAWVEVEPFKTAISLHFQREWPFVLWALATLVASVAVYRGYCRYLCPLGAALALMGRVRVLAWIPRRAACGTPCQSCRHRCAYQAIDPAGRIDYTECFQCLDCVAIHDDPRRCLPLIRATRTRLIPLQPMPTKPVAEGAR